MNRIYKISFYVYRIILVLIVPLIFFAKLMVGAAGHNSKVEITDYFIFIFVILTPILLTAFKKIDHTKITRRKILRFSTIVLVTVSIIFLLYGLYDFYILYQELNFGIGDNIPVAIIILLITLSSTLLVGLVKNRI